MKKYVVVDIDGTVANLNHRLHYVKNTNTPDYESFYANVKYDAPIFSIINLVKLLKQTHTILFCTGRDEICQYETKKWLIKYIGAFATVNLFMRREGDLREDEIVKPELLVENNINFSDIEFILEDKQTVVDMWRTLGITCLEVAQNDFKN